MNRQINDSSIEFRLPGPHKQAFMFLCKRRGITMSKVLQGLVYDYINQKPKTRKNEGKFQSKRVRSQD